MTLPISQLACKFKPLDRSAQQRKELIVRTLADRLLLAAKIAPVLFVVEDAHWIDPSTSEVLKEVVSRMHGAAILVVVTHRPEWIPPCQVVREKKKRLDQRARPIP